MSRPRGKATAKRKAEPETRPAMLNVRCDRALLEAFNAACSSQDQTASQEVRRFMREYVAQHGQGSLLR